VSTADFGVVYLGFTGAGFASVRGLLAPSDSVVELLRAAVCPNAESAVLNSATTTNEHKLEQVEKDFGDDMVFSLKTALKQPKRIYLCPWFVDNSCCKGFLNSSHSHQGLSR
jgi:hypothetical protein